MSNSDNKKSIQVKLTDLALKQIVAEAVLRDESVREVFKDTNVSISANWHIFKWDDPDHLVTFTLTESE